jgi:hypothetical protein
VDVGETLALAIVLLPCGSIRPIHQSDVENLLNLLVLFLRKAENGAIPSRYPVKCKNVHKQKVLGVM